MRSAPRVRCGLREMTREHVREVGSVIRFARSRLMDPAAPAGRARGRRSARTGRRRRARVDVRVAALLAEPRAHHPHHVVIGPVALRADAPVGRPELRSPQNANQTASLSRAQMLRRKSSSTMASSPSTGETSAAAAASLAGAAVLVREVAQGLRQQPFLAAEMQVDDALAEARFLGHGGDRRVGEAAVGDAADRGLDELLAALFGRRRAALRDDRELTFRAHKNPCHFSRLCETGTHGGRILPGSAAQSNE